MAESEESEDKLERPKPKGAAGWETLYRSRHADVSNERPIFTGDVFELAEPLPGSSATRIMIAQHPCALRIDGAVLGSRLLVIEVALHPTAHQMTWSGNYKNMPLPALDPDQEPGSQHYVAMFDNPLVVGPEELTAANRVACLSQTGVNLLLQRWVHHNSRVVVPTHKYQDVTGGPFDEADLIEEWCEDFDDIEAATKEAVEYLRQNRGDGLTRQDALKDPQQKSAIRIEMRKHLKSLSES